MASIRVVATGGTIDNRRPEDAAAGSEPGSEVEGLVEAISSKRLFEGEIEVSRWGRRPGAGLGPADFVELADHLEQVTQAGADGVVVTIGTDMLEECAYALACLLRPRAPVVLTGAMRRSGEPGADGEGNLAAAIVAATEPSLAARSPLVVFGDQVMSSVLVAKSESTAPNAFESEGGSRLGVVAEGAFYSSMPDPAAHYVGPPKAPLPAVELIWVAAGADAHSTLAAARAGRPVVLAAAGGGHVHSDLVPGVQTLLDAGLPVVLSTRCRRGPTLTRTYAGPGSETQLLTMGVLSAGMLSPLKARLRLIYGLAAGRKPEELFPVDAAGPRLQRTAGG